jgi:hypothetical protein
MQTQSSEFGKLWGVSRDVLNVGVSERDNRELFHITQVEYAPPSKAHLKRLARVRAIVEQRRISAKQPDPVRLEYNERDMFIKTVARAIRPDYKTPIATREPNPVRSVPHIEKQMPGDEERRERIARQNLRRDHLIALGRASKPMLSAKHSVEIHELWDGDFTAYLQEIAR